MTDYPLRSIPPFHCRRLTENTQADYSDSLLTDILLRIYVAGAIALLAFAAFSR